MIWLYIVLAIIALAILTGAVQRSGFKMPTISLTDEHKKYILWGICGMIGLSVLGVVASYSSLGVSFWVPAALVILLAILGGMGKAGGVGTIASWLVGAALIGYLTLHIAFGENSGDVIETWQKKAVSVAKGDEGPSPSVQVPSSHSNVKTATWEKTAQDGSLPVGEWSNSIKTLPGCDLYLAHGNGTVYKYQYRILGGEWKDHTPKTMVDGDEGRFMLLQTGVSEIPVRIKCL